MVARKQKKVTKYRSKTTHGGGHRKKRRGAGSRGGRGNAGTGKRAGHKKAGGMVITGKNGFTPRRTKSGGVSLNIGYFTKDKADKLVQKNKASKEGEVYVIDLKKALKCTKLLGTGTTSLKLKLIVEKCSPRAEEKIKELGGEIVLPNSSKTQ